MFKFIVFGGCQILTAFGLSMTCDITGLLPGRGASEAAYSTQNTLKRYNAINRFATAKDRLQRLKLSVDLDVKAKVIAASVYPVAFHGAELPFGQQRTRPCVIVLPRL